MDEIVFCLINGNYKKCNSIRTKDKPMDVATAYPMTPQNVAPRIRDRLFDILEANAAAVDAPPILAFEATRTSGNDNGIYLEVNRF
jgi:hypothetical protein